MAMMKLVFLLLAVAVYDIKCAVNTPQTHFTAPAPTLTCTEDGLQVAVEFGTFTTATYSQVGTLTLGTDDSVTACRNADLPLTGTSATTENLDLAGTTVAYEDAGTCGGALSETTTELVYTNTLRIDVEETNAQIVRTYRYSFSLTCTLTRIQTEAGSPSFTVESALVLETAEGTQTGVFDLDVALEFLDASGSPENSAFTVNNGDELSLRVAEVDASGALNDNADYRFTVQRCYASQDSDHANSDLVDDFLVDECPTDNTVVVTPGPANQNTFTFTIRAFYLSGRPTDSVFIHCELFVCRVTEADDSNSGKCVQEDSCPSVGRKRRSVEAEEERKPVFASTKNSFQVAVSGVRCPTGFVYDASLDECTNQRLLLIKGVYLGLEWNSAYANVSSPAFKQFARVTGAQLEALIINANKQNVIKGLKIVAAREGSVILDVLVTYAENVDHVVAFQAFENVVLKTTPQMTRIVNLLNIRQDKVIEYVQVAANDGNKTNMEMILVVVIVAAVILIAFICGITFYRVQQTRPRHAAPAPATVPNVFDNKAMESI